MQSRDMMPRKTNVLLVYEGFIASVRLCGYEQLRYLQDAGQIHFRHLEESRITRQQCCWADVVFFVRCASWLSWKTAQCCKRAGKFIIYAMDDDLLNVAPYASSALYYWQNPVRKRIRWFIQNSSIFISPSEYLIQKYQGLASKTAKIEEPCLNKNIGKLGSRALEKAGDRNPEETVHKNNASEKAGNRDSAQEKARNRNLENPEESAHRRLKIGFAGSVDRALDVQELLRGALEEFLEKHGDEAEIEFMGFTAGFAAEMGIACHPYEQDYGNYQKKFYQLGWDVGLAPMPDTEFHRGKHYNKYIEYGSAGCVGIYSDAIPYRYIIRDKENGILCTNTKEGWLEAMEWCLGNRDKLAGMRENVLADMREKFQVSQVAGRLADGIPELTGYLSPQKRFARLAGVYRKVGWLVRSVEFLSRYGLASYKKAMAKLRGDQAGAVNVQ